jgi:hypothetical protein
MNIFRGRPTTVRTVTTTTSSFSRGYSDRGRKPVNRSRSKYTTTTEQYSDSFYDPTKRNFATTSTYNEQDTYIKKGSIGSQKYVLGNDKTRQSTEAQVLYT